MRKRRLQMEEFSNIKDPYREQYVQPFDEMITIHLERVNVKNNNFRREK